MFLAIDFEKVARYFRVGQQIVLRSKPFNWGKENVEDKIGRSLAEGHFNWPIGRMKPFHVSVIDLIHLDDWNPSDMKADNDERWWRDRAQSTLAAANESFNALPPEQSFLSEFKWREAQKKENVRAITITITSSTVHSSAIVILGKQRWFAFVLPSPSAFVDKIRLKRFKYFDCSRGEKVPLTSSVRVSSQLDVEAPSIPTICTAIERLTVDDFFLLRHNHKLWSIWRQFHRLLAPLKGEMGWRIDGKRKLNRKLC